MGIYSNGIIYGIKVIQKNLDENCDLNDEYITIYEKVSNNALNKSDYHEIKEFIHKDWIKDNNIRFLQYIQCCTSYDKDDKPFMIWERIDKMNF